MRKIVRWFAVVACLLLLAIVGVWYLSRTLGPTARQEAALALLDKEDPVEGPNAFAALWLLGYDVPEGQQQAVTAEDAARFERTSKPNAPDFTAAPFESAAASRFKDLSPSEADWGKFCKPRVPDCLANVRADRAGYSALIDRNGRLIDKAVELRRYGHYRNAFPNRLDMPFPQFQYAIAPMTRHAVNFVDGDTDAALAGVCADMAAWRRIGPHSDSLIARMIGIAYATDGYARLLADMLAELPGSHPLPTVCASALAIPSVDESLICEAMKGESQYIRSGAMALASAPKPVDNTWVDFFFPALYSPEMAQARVAPAHAYACSTEMRNAAAADVPVVFSAIETQGMGFDCVGNIAGCILLDLDTPRFDLYIQRGQDYTARLRLMATLLWLRDHADGETTVDQLLRKRPSFLVSPGHDIEVVDGGKALRIAQFDATRDKYWQIASPRMD